MRFMCAALSAAHRPERRDEVVRLSAIVPMERVPAVAAAHGIEGCLHVALEHVPGIDRAVIDELAAARRGASVRHLLSTRSLGAIDTLLRADGVRLLAFKGPVLSSTLYGDAGLRSYGDLDILVPRSQFAHAVRLLEREGYLHLVQNWKALEHFRAGEVTMQRDDIPIDVHWHVLYAFYDRRPFRLDPQDFFERARRVTIGGREVMTFDAVDTLLHLSLHAARSGAHRLIWMKDIERSVAVDRPDFDELLARTRAARCAPPVGLALHRARRALEVDVPLELVEAMVGRPLAAIERFVARRDGPAPIGDERSLMRLIARTVGPNLGSTLSDAVRKGYYELRAIADGRRGLHTGDVDNPLSLNHRAGDDADKLAFLNGVSQG